MLSTLRSASKLGSSFCKVRNHLLKVDAVRNVSQANIDIKRLEKVVIPESDSFIQNIFTGEAKVQNFFPYPKVLSAEEFSFVEMITEPAEKIYSTEYDPLKVEETGELDEKHLQLLKDMGAFGVMVPPEYGGMGLNNTQYARLGEVTVGFDLGITIFLGAHQSIGYKGLLLYGNKEQKERYLPELASGSKIAAFALTEPSAGSDASGIKSRAVLSEEKVCQTDRKRSKVRALQKKFRRPPRDSDEEESESESDGFGKHSTDIATEWAVRKAKGKNCKRGMPGGSGDAGAAQRQKQEQIKRRKERIQQHNRRLQLDKGSQSHWAEELTTPALDLVQGIPASVPAAAAQVASVKPSVFGRDAAEDSDEVVLLPSPPPAPTPKRRSRRGGKKRKRNARRKSTTAATTPTLINPVKSTAEYSYKIDNTKFIDKPGLRAMGYGVIWDENSYVELLSIEDCMPCSLEDIRDLHLDHHLKGLPAYEEEKAQIKAKKAEESGGEEKVVKEEEEKAVVMDRITIRQLKNLHKDYERRVGPSKDGLTVVRLLAVITGRHRFTHKMKVLVEWDDYSTALVDLGDLAKRALPLPHLFQEQLAKVLLTEHNYKANHRWPVLLQSELNGPRGLNEVVLPLLKAIVKRAKALKALGQTIDGALKEGIHSVFTTTAWMEFTQERHFFGGPSAAAAAKGSLKRSGRSKASTSAVPATEPYQVYLAPGTHRREDVTMRLDELERLPLHLCKSCHRFFMASDVDLLLHLLKEDVHEGFVLPPTPRDQEEVERLKAVYGKVVKLWNQAEAAAEVVKEMAATPLENGKSASKRKLQASKKETEEEKVSQKLKKLKMDDDEEE